MTIKAIQYVSDPTVAGLQLPNSVADCCTVMAIFPQGQVWGSRDESGLFTVIDKDITVEEESDLLMRKKAIDRSDPAGAFLSIHVDDQISDEPPPEQPKKES